ncbi:hypothetical protein I7I50_00627 [Histoplasma capsulatum G186AR]|uniref:Uncharacterized protein n=1 Tax=Ajellomyces capsulatus TaxID=5037 RepID=A0A8H7YJ79_AJECA|nr:hypothetical protein I7I52_07895 [Histoplasma capsulatum]QSS72700.1 hypothetical protein I7I50_00627 [Histoplasma capsulatum G186AR]
MMRIVNWAGNMHGELWKTAKGVLTQSRASSVADAYRQSQLMLSSNRRGIQLRNAPETMPVECQTAVC